VLRGGSGSDAASLPDEKLKSVHLFSADTIGSSVWENQRLGTMARWAVRARTVRIPSFIPPMELLAVTPLPEGRDWSYEVKLDAYRAASTRIEWRPRLQHLGCLQPPRL